MNELPTMLKSSSTSATYSPDSWSYVNMAQGGASGLSGGFVGGAPIGYEAAQANVPAALRQAIINQAKGIPTMADKMRIVKVFIADPNENLPLKERLLYLGEEKLTDLTDQELFFELPIQELLVRHNDMRKKTIDKKQAEKFGRDIFMEPARVRDLRMTVVDVATF